MELNNLYNMENKEDIINLGEWNCPKSWDELDLKTFSDIERYYADKENEFDVRDVLHILCGKTKDEINALPIEFAEKIINDLSWLEEVPEYGAPTNELVIDGEKYIINVQEKLKTGEYVACDTIIKQDPHNYAAILAVLCRKAGEAYDSKFENEILPSRIKMFEAMPMMKVMTLISFFLNLWVALESYTQLYSKVVEATNLIQKRIETSSKNGHLSLLSTILLKRKLKKLRKSMPHI